MRASRSRAARAAGSVLVALGLAACGGSPAPAGTPEATIDRPFSSDSPFNLPIPPDVGSDPRSAEIVEHLTAGANPVMALMYEYGVPVYNARQETPRYAVRCLRPWGDCQLEEAPVPIPAQARPSEGTDASLVVVDWWAGKSYEFWQAAPGADGWTASWGGVVDLRGPGTPGQAVGAGVSRLAGVVRVNEVVRGHIDHALVFSTDNACAGTFRYPASRTDGHSERSDCIELGSRLQLDPELDLDGLELSDAERTVARALQRFGAYAVDNGGARVGLVFEAPRGEDPYPELGLDWDYKAFSNVPWSRLRVLPPMPESEHVYG